MAVKYFTSCLIIYFVLICNTNSDKSGRYRQIFQMDDVVFNYETCKVNTHKIQLKANMKNNLCKPVNTVVDLYLNSQHVMMHPDKVVVKRCYETGCYGRNSCVANNTREIPVAVSYINTIPQRNHRNHQLCGWVYVTEHVQCTCGCNIDKDQCEQEGKIYNVHDCTCKCPNEMKRKAECHKQSNMVWDEYTCSCRCTKEMMECTTGTEWVPKYCKCMKIMM